MSIQNISVIKNISFKANPDNATSIKETQTEAKQDTKKITLALAGLAAIGLATVGAVYQINKGKGKKVTEPAQGVAQEITQKIKGLTRGEDIPFDRRPEKVNITMQTTKGFGKNAEYKTYANEKITQAKYYGKYNGRDVIVEEKLTSAHSGIGTYAFIRDKETNELITAKKLTSSGKEMPFTKQPEKGGVLRTNVITENGVQETYKNGKLFSTTTTEINPDGSKRIIVNYKEKNIQPAIIEIDAQGNRVVKQEGRNLLYM